MKCSQIFAGFFYVLPRCFCSFSVDGQQDGAKILAFAEELRKAAAVIVRAGGVAVGVVADEAPGGVAQRHEVRAEAVFVLPVVEQDAGVRVFAASSKCLVSTTIFTGKPHFRKHTAGPQKEVPVLPWIRGSCHS